MKNILLTGANGFIGSYFRNKYNTKYNMKSFSFLNDNFNELNLLDRDTVVHLSALVHQMGGASKVEYEKVNVTQTITLAKKAKESRVKHFIFMSSIKVYGEETDIAYNEKSACNPMDDYGKSKLKGEQHIREICDRYFIIRTAWLYGKNGPNFVKTMLRLFKEKEMINVVQDQIGTPTYTKDLAKTILSIIASSSDIEKSSIIDKDNNCYGIYHYTNLGKTSWFYFANEVYQQARLLGLIEKEVKINPISTDKYPTRAVRPQNSYLLKDKIIEKFNLSIPSWQNSLQEFLGEFKNQ